MTEGDVTKTAADAADQAIAELIDRTVNGIDAGTEFMQEQLPDYIHQLLAWFFWYNVAWATIWLVFMLALLFIAYRLYKIDADPDNKEATVFFLFGAVPMVPCFFISIDFWMDALQVHIAPKVFLVNYAAGLIR